MRTIYFVQSIFSALLMAHVSGAVGAPAPSETPAPLMPPVGASTGASTGSSAGASAKAAVTVLSRAVGEVGERVITSREVRINDAIEQAINGKPARPEGYRVLSGQEKTFPGEVSRVLDEWVVFLEAKTLASQAPARADLGAALKAVQEQWGAKLVWQELEASPEEIRDTLERKLLAREFERLKSDPQLAPVSDEDALAYYRKNRLRFGSMPFSSFKDNIKTYLVKQQTERRLAEWREVLRRKYKVRNFISG